MVLSKMKVIARPRPIAEAVSGFSNIINRRNVKTEQSLVYIWPAYTNIDRDGKNTCISLIECKVFHLANSLKKNKTMVLKKS